MTNNQSCRRCHIPKPHDTEHFPTVSGYLLRTCRQCINKDAIARRKQPGVREECNKRKVLSNRALKMEVMQHYSGGKCECCGEANIMFLTIDHINGGGTKHRQSIGKKSSGYYFYKWLKVHGYPKGYRCLCYNCNCGANANGGICPHRLGDIEK